MQVSTPLKEQHSDKLTFESTKYKDHYYEVVDRAGQGTTSVVYYVMLRAKEDHRAVQLYAAKMIGTQYLDDKTGQNRREDLKREVSILGRVDPATSVTLVEVLYDHNCFIIVQDLANGGTLNNLLGARDQKLSSIELRVLIKKIT